MRQNSSRGYEMPHFFHLSFIYCHFWSWLFLGYFCDKSIFGKQFDGKMLLRTQPTFLLPNREFTLISEVIFYGIIDPDSTCLGDFQTWAGYSSHIWRSLWRVILSNNDITNSYIYYIQTSSTMIKTKAIDTVEHEIHACPMYSEFRSFAS